MPDSLTQNFVLSLVADTNCLRGRGPLDRHSIEKALDEAKGLNIAFKFLIPRVSIAEIAVQATWLMESALAQLKNSQKALGRYQRFEPSPSADTLRFRVLREILQWCAKYNGVLVQAPIKTIDWHRLITNAIWRKPPFSPYEPDESKAKEKGFRDALILETVCEVHRSDPGKPLHFVSEDGLMRRAAEERFAGVSNVHVHKNFEEFLGTFRAAKKQNVELPVQTLPLDTYAWLSANPLIHDYLSGASSHFYDPVGPTMFQAFNILGQIHQQINDLGLATQPFNYGASLYGSNPTENYSFHPQNNTFRVGSTTYQYEDDQGRSHWNTEVDAMSLMVATISDQPPLSFSFIVVHQFTVQWSCLVTPEHKYLDDSVEAINYERTYHEEASPDALDQFYFTGLL